MFATALAQAVVTVIAPIVGLGSQASGPLEILAVNGSFVALFVGSAWVLRHAVAACCAEADSREPWGGD